MTLREIFAGVAVGLLAGCAGCPELCDPQDERPGFLVDPACAEPYRVKLQIIEPDEEVALSAGQSLPVPPRVRVVLDGASDIPLEGARVRFQVVQGGGTLSGGGVSGPTVDVHTDAQGEASVGWQVGPVPGVNQLRVEVPTTDLHLGDAPVGLAFGSPAIITAQASVRVAASIVKQAGDSGAAQAGTPLPVRPRVRLSDELGALPGQMVRFEVRNGGGSITGSPTVTTDASGEADVEWVLGQGAGTYNNRLAAIVDDDPELEVEFVASGIAGPAVILVPITPATQTAQAGADAPLPPRVRLADQFDNSVVGVDVTFTVGATGGTVDDAPQVVIATDASGIAAVGRWTLGSAPGTYDVAAEVFGPEAGTINGNPASFAATATPAHGPPVSMAVAQGEGQSLVVGQAVQVLPAVRVADAQDRPVPGVVLLFTAGFDSGVIRGGTATTDASGIATLGGWTLGPMAGTQYVIVTPPSGSGIAPANLAVSVTAVPAAPRTIVKVAGDNQVVPPGVAVPVRPTVEVRDQFGNPVPGVSVDFAIESGGGSVSGGSQTTDGLGRARVGGWTLGPAVGTNLLVAMVPPPAGNAMAVSMVVFTATGSGGAGVAGERP
ncbi:MAG: Ig-like domain-containing protein [Gemmatimonadales bacterium]